MAKVDNVSDSIKDEILRVMNDYQFSPMTGSTISNLELDYSKIVHDLVTSRDIIISDEGSTITLSNEELLQLLPLIPIYDKEVLNHSYSGIYINTHYYGEVWYTEPKSDDTESSKKMQVGYPCDVRLKLDSPVEYVKIEFTVST